MQGVSRWVFWHDMVRDIGFHDVGNWLIDFQERQLSHEFKGIRPSGEISSFKFFDDRFAGVYLIIGKMFVPPLARPFPPSDVIWFGANLIIKTRYRGFDISAGFHFLFLNCLNHDLPDSHDYLDGAIMEILSSGKSWFRRRA